mmetsp:Transcript_16239/g.44968  ORF Transcript_16239/g.44968 Transcript_16239/m.44968 type:complete len:383 (+) Transcript_16239:180-1328(+)|eukprot:CAMPEP_0172373868 /NCGR_PEP_ID=MMETSP1060-20121228/53547_1 /TAXON_ID=37318 /ORGANISM="Pseudo-nitzschia pungens, Strain cf. cingulata" /LENGTH=382 /DNA_ID=CAMNT_0013100333 /DNA_START=153 /DNA_END=1301 /DNA_ORIENTATION=-
MTAHAANREKKTEGSWRSGVAGFSGGAVSTMLLLPLDNIKVRLQVNEGVTTKAATTSSENGTGIVPSKNGSPAKKQPKPQTRLGAMRMLQGVIKYEGVRGLYQGLVPAIVGSAVSWGGFFFVYETMKQQLRNFKSINNSEHANGKKIGNGAGAATRGEIQKPETLNAWDNFVLGTASGAVMVFMTNPIWLIKLRLQLQMKRTSEHLHVKNVTRYDGFLDAFRKIYRSEGIVGLYKGTGPALLLTSHGGVQFVVYEFLRKHFHYAKAQRSTESSSVMKRFENSLGYLTMGAISKMAASTITYPMQVVKSRIQQPSSSIELTNTGDVRVVRRNYAGLVSTMQKMWRQEGISCFFKGAIPNAVRVAPNAAVTFLVYESVLDILQS